FRIRLIMTPLAALTQQVATGGGEGGRWRRQFPTGSTVVASIVVTRAAGPDTADCAGDPGPPPGAPR
ncbi:MAG TPA: hypothetical protein VLL08_22315, partial [Kineosporiaceae bacterium]|nr:hypothetical protein [Kineosporiaceae bacterium]